jgi:hypothetical protein
VNLRFDIDATVSSNRFQRDIQGNSKAHTTDSPA